MAQLIKAAKGEIPCDLVLENARIVNVFAGKIFAGSVAVYGQHIVGFGPRPTRLTIDIKGQYLLPGLIDSHVHIESSMTCPSHYARAVVPHGATAVVADPHEIANVLGVDGISYMIKASKDQPMGFFYTLPSCVPATHMETSGAAISANDLKELFDDPCVVGLAEMMNFPGVLFADPVVMEKLAAAKHSKKPVDGHAPGLLGNDLHAYLTAGPASDHECTSPAEALEKLEAGMFIMIREGTGAKNLDALLPIVTEKNSRRIMLCTDDRHPHDLLDRGHIDSMIATCIAKGLDPITAISMASINTAQYFGLHDQGAIGPGKRADLVVVEDLDDFKVRDVYYGGQHVVENGQMILPAGKSLHKPMVSSINVLPGLLDFSIPASTRRARVIELISGQVITNMAIEKIREENGFAVSDTQADILKIAVIERHYATGNIGLGFVKGFSLKKGAIASSVAHDSHNIIVVGVNDADMRAAVDSIISMGGGLSAACEGRAVSTCPLPIAGLMSDQPMEVVRNHLDGLLKTAREFGALPEDPFMTLSFLALPVIPRLKLTDKGLVDVEKFELVSLFE